MMLVKHSSEMRGFFRYSNNPQYSTVLDSWITALLLLQVLVKA